MILTLTPNPTIDRAVFCRDFRLGGIVRAERELVIPSGKGVDASLVLHELGARTRVLGLQAGLNGRLHADLLDQWGLVYDMVPAHGETRTAIVLVDLAANKQSTISAPTLTAREEQLTGLLDSLRRNAEGAWGVIFGGSLPPGLPHDSYARLLRLARKCGLVTLLDTSRHALCQGVRGLPDILKINLSELHSLIESDVGARSSRPQAAHPVSESDRDVGARSSRPQALDLECPGEWVRFLAERLGEWAGQAIVITVGSRGALAVTQEASYVVRPPVVPIVNTAGAGDALDAGLMLALSQGEDWPSALALGTAAAASVVMNEGTAICRREQVEEWVPRIQIERQRRENRWQRPEKL